MWYLQWSILLSPFFLFYSCSSIVINKREAIEDLDPCCGDKMKLPEIPTDCEDFQQKDISFNDHEATHNDLICLARCMAMSNKFLEPPGGTFNKDAFIEWTQKIDDDVDRQTIAMNSFDQCVTEAEENRGIIVNEMKLKLNCCPRAYLFGMCIIRETLLQCPSEKAMQSEQCSKYTAMLQKNVTEIF